MSDQFLKHLLQNPEALKTFVAEGQRRFGSAVQARGEQEALVERVKAQRTKLLPAQLALVRDKSRRIAALCTRQAGKSHVVAHMLGEAALRRPRMIIPYIALTKETCRDIMWPKLQEWCDAVKVPVHFNENTMRLTFPNESVIRMVGAEKPKEIEKLRGLTPPLAAIDESGTFGAHLEDLIRNVLAPSLMRYGGRVVSIGTPGEVADGWFYRITTQKDPGWSIHRWSFLDNLHLPPEARDLDRICRDEYGGDPTAPGFRREYLGEWVADTGTRVYAGYDPANSHWNGVLPAGDWLYGLGVDLGSKDGSTFALVAFSLDDPNLYVLEETKLSRPGNRHLTVSEVAEVISQYMARYQLMRIVVDSGALGAMIVEEMRQRFALPLTPAEKTHKNDFIEAMNSDFRLGRIKLDQYSATAAELSRLVWDDRLSVTGKRREKPSLSNDRCDALLYIYRESKHWAGKTPEEDICPPGLSDLDWQERKRIDKYFEQVENRSDEEGWFYG